MLGWSAATGRLIDSARVTMRESRRRRRELDEVREALDFWRQGMGWAGRWGLGFWGGRGVGVGGGGGAVGRGRGVADVMVLTLFGPLRRLSDSELVCCSLSPKIVGRVVGVPCHGSQPALPTSNPVNSAKMSPLFFQVGCTQYASSVVKRPRRPAPPAPAPRSA